MTASCWWRRCGLPMLVTVCLNCVVGWVAINKLFLSDDHQARGSVVFVSASVALLWLISVKYIQDLLRLKESGPIPMPLLGNTLSFIAKKNLQESVKALIETYGNVQDYLDMLLDCEYTVLVNDAEFCRQAMKSTDRGMTSPKSLSTWRGNFLAAEVWGSHGLDMFTLAEDDWKARRRILQPAFDQRHVRIMLNGISDSVLLLVERLKRMSTDSNRTSINVLPVLQDFGLHVICSTSFGLSVNVLTDDISNDESSDGAGRWLIDCLTLQTKLFNEYQFYLFLRFHVKFLTWLGLNRQELERREISKRFRDFTRRLVLEEMQRQLKEKSPSQTKGNSDGIDSPQNEAHQESLLSLMVSTSLAQEKVENGHKNESPTFGPEEIMDEIISFIFAGYDTTSVTLSLLLNHIATHPHVQRRVHDEIDLMLQQQDGTKKMKVAHIIQKYPLPYLTACIRESQRIQPVAPINKRRLHIDLKLPSSSSGEVPGATVPKGSLALIPVYMLHRDETQYPNPEEFQPERWLDTTSKTSSSGLKPIPNGYFYPFGAGPKMCVGFQLAEKQVKMAALGMLANFELESCQEIQIRDAFVTGPQAVHLRFQDRKIST